MPEGAGNIDLLAEVLHRLLEQCELIHVELLLLLASSSLGSHAACRPPKVRESSGNEDAEFDIMDDQNEYMRKLFSSVTTKIAPKKESRINGDAVKPQRGVAEELDQRRKDRMKNDKHFVDKYAPIIRPLANMIATGPYDKEHDHKEESRPRPANTWKCRGY